MLADVAVTLHSNYCSVAEIDSNFESQNYAVQMEAWSLWDCFEYRLQNNGNRTTSTDAIISKQILF